ncbi:MAG: histidine triad nucleotide-binding protein [Gammaproteobacteria bacterium]|nr:MAG: histidine triad nucleotide-binding protein [Gammaproteobacteria bacterium]
MSTVFSKIINGELPADKLHEDEHCIVIRDINPQAPVHLLIIPRREIPRLVDATQDDQALLGHLMLVARKMAVQLGVQEAFRLVLNNGESAGQTVFHVHMHLLAGQAFPERSLAS